MLHINAAQMAISLLNSTLGLDELPMEVHGRIATALILLDQQCGEDFFAALQDAYSYIGKDTAELDSLLAEMEDDNDGEN